ncbi:hypothetical protein AQ619_05905 [Caulobacter henricii]|uniref:Uncharacterized protein n=2 Tax=Caulobacter henricii TaxID=69395 RepID=A0A0P0NXY6_9CAUL|nr:hypothetical protein AQ619_05905 [Caulobacter henricii]
MKAIRDDIAFMRALAEEGRQAPLLGGSMLVSAGAIFGTASLIQWAVLSQVLRMPSQVLAVVWIAAFILHMIMIFVLKRGMGERPGAGSSGNRAMRNAWMGVGWGCFVIFTALAVASWKTRDINLINFSPSIVLALYGGAWSVAAAMSQATWLRFVAVASFAGSIAMAMLMGNSWAWLGYAGALYLLAMVPGLILMRQEPSDTI